MCDGERWGRGICGRGLRQDRGSDDAKTVRKKIIFPWAWCPVVESLADFPHQMWCMVSSSPPVARSIKCDSPTFRSTDIRLTFLGVNYPQPNVSFCFHGNKSLNYLLKYAHTALHAGLPGETYPKECHWEARFLKYIDDKCIDKPINGLRE